MVPPGRATADHLCATASRKTGLTRSKPTIVPAGDPKPGVNARAEDRLRRERPVNGPPKRGLQVGQPIMYTSVHVQPPCGTDWEIRPTTGGWKPATAGRSFTICGFSLPDGHGKCPSLAPVLFELAETPAAVSRGDRPRRSSLMGSPIAQFPAAARDRLPGNVPGVGSLVLGLWTLAIRPTTIPRGMPPPLAWTNVRGKRKQQKRSL